jgi:hypothetical protein
MPMDRAPDYRKFYDSEEYLISEVGKAFRETGELDPVDFLTMLIWKAERAKGYHKERLAKIGGTFANAVHDIALGIHQCVSHKERLKLLMEKWWFYLPTATAILSLLYPGDFTVFDWRVCDELGMDYERWESRVFADALWEYYVSFIEAVMKGTPADLSLRDRDRFLIGRSNRKATIEECRAIENG